MARSPFTLVAAVTAAIPGAEVTGARSLTADGDGRFDSAVATLATGREVAIRVADDDDGARELAAEALALRALTLGARAMLPFRAPEYLGETRVGDGRALAADFLPGFQVDAAHLPAGPGAARSAGAAIAAVHALPASVVRAAGLPERTADDARAELRTLVDRAAATGRVPARLIVRWRGALDDDGLWRFAPSVTLGGVEARSFLYRDDPVTGPVVVGLLGWHGLSIGDPSVDFAWLSTAPDAAADVRDAYASSVARTPDEAIATRGRLRAELEFARWLVHGDDLHDDSITDDAASLLDALAERVRENDLAEIAARTEESDAAVQSALGAAERIAAGSAPTVDTSMHTDTYTPEELWLTQEPASETAATAAPAPPSAESDDTESADPEATHPIDAGFLTAPHDDEPDEEAQRAARAALQRWTNSASE